MQEKKDRNLSKLAAPSFSYNSNNLIQLQPSLNVIGAKYGQSSNCTSYE